MKIWLYPFTLLLAACCNLPEQGHYNISRNTIVQTLKSEFSGNNHDLIITLPGSYHKGEDQSYPVLYYTDAQWDTPLITSIVGKLNYDRSLLEIILVGITYSGADAEYDKLRVGDLTPSIVEAHPAETGGADTFIKFIESTVIPHIEKNFRADLEERALGGVSLGGLFSLYAMYKKPELFKRFISISPAVHWGNRFMLTQDESYASENTDLPARLFLTYGGGEYFEYTAPIIEFQERLESRDYQDLELFNWKIEDERHGGVSIEGWARGLRWAFKDITPYKPGPLEEHYKATQKESAK
ncbi:alpha/beta hydrolase-fold protein [Puniceicoccaceae bacterium K14]|nr:alpha/beta hydrolase-fold protein [Puniceicoccaceae bacterium K14]